MRTCPRLVLAPPVADQARFHELRALFAANGHCLQLTLRGDYRATIYLQTREFGDLDAVERFLKQEGG